MNLPQPNHQRTQRELLRQSITTSIVIATLAANAGMFLTTRLLPKDVSSGQHFAFTINSTNTRGTIDFFVTVTPKTSELFFDASLACFDGEGQITKSSLEDPAYTHTRGERCEYHFGVASNLLAHSQFILRYSRREQVQEERAADSIWFFLRDFAPNAQTNNDTASSSRPAAVELPRPNSGRFTLAQAEARKSEIYSIAQSGTMTDWKNPYMGFGVHITRDDQLVVYGSSSPSMQNGKISLPELESAVLNYPLYGNPLGVLITSERDVGSSATFRRLLELLFKPHVQIFYYRRA